MAKPAQQARPGIERLIGKQVAGVSAKMTEAQAGEKVVELSLRDISPDPGQPRKFFDKKKNDELAESIRQQGVVSPIIVRPNPSGSGHMIVFGERRWISSGIAGKKTIKAVVRPYTDKDLKTIRAIQAAENSQRADLTLAEKIAQAEELQQWYNVKETAAIMGEPALYVTKTRKVSKAGGHVAEALEERLCEDLDALYLLADVQAKDEAAAGKIVGAWRDPERKRGGWRADVQKVKQRLDHPEDDDTAHPGRKAAAEPAAAPADPAAAKTADIGSARPVQNPTHERPAAGEVPQGGAALDRGAHADSDGGNAGRAESSQQPAVRRSSSAHESPADAGAVGGPAALAPPRTGLEATPEPLAGMKATGDIHQALNARIDGERVLVETDRGTFAFNMHLLKLMERLV